MFWEKLTSNIQDEIDDIQIKINLILILKRRKYEYGD